MAEKAEIDIGGGASIKGNVAAPAEQVAIGQGNMQTDASNEAGRDVLQAQYDQRTELRDLDQSQAQRNFDQSSDRRRYEQRYDSPSGGQQVTFQNPDSARIWEALIRVENRVSNVDVKLDDLPARVGRLEVQFQPVPVPLPVVYPPLWVWLAIVSIAALIGAFFAGRGF